jgi:DnaK suppressor protein
MSTKLPPLDKAFVQKQRDRLTKLRQQLSSATRREESEEAGINTTSVAEAHESEDDAQRLALLEIEGEVGARSQQRLTQIERALQKIADGTYGLSDKSGKPIPRERLEAIPETIYTLEEIKALDAASSRPGTGGRKS